MSAEEEVMKQTIILLTMVILGIAISSMILSFNDIIQNITDTTQTQMEERLDLNSL
jgi:hypothetical protein